MYYLLSLLNDKALLYLLGWLCLIICYPFLYLNYCNILQDVVGVHMYGFSI